jgi:hypothetical protein
MEWDGENGTGLIIDEVDDARYPLGMPRTARIAPGGMLFQDGENGTGLIIDEVDDARYPLGMPRTARIAPGGMLFRVLNREDRIIRPVPFSFYAPKWPAMWCCICWCVG